MATQPNPFLEAQAELAEAERLRLAQKRGQARKICEGLIKRYPDYVGALHTLGLVLADLGDLEGALSKFIKASLLNPKDWKTLTVLSSVYLKLGSREMAARTLEQAQKYNPTEASVSCTLGDIYLDDGEYELAADAFRSALNLDPGFSFAKRGLGISLTHLGLFAHAAEIFRDLVDRGDRSPNLLGRLADLYRLNGQAGLDAVADIMRFLDEAAPQLGQRKQDFASALAFARATALDVAGRYIEAWELLVEANEYRLRQAQEESDQHLTAGRTFLQHVKADRASEEFRPKLDSDLPQSLFILGPSRSGKTTLEMLLGQLTEVKRGYENQLCESAVRRTFQTAGFPTRQMMIELPYAFDAQCREYYIQEVKERRVTEKVWTNTLPGRIQSVRRIADVVPNAKFVFVKRNIDDLTIRIYMKNYASGNAYSYSVTNIRDYVSWYYEMIDLFADRLPSVSRVIRYEDMVSNPAKVLSTVAELCGISTEGSDVSGVGDDRNCSEPYRSLIENAKETDN